ncbi:P-type conjugative transfer ATPase TrbB [uncultured Bilophila sp.]|uniref:P-type conjugative transfer ATPase TrbB n=1 Tax=uncultured Bilophila sp. TaxID=529385 RepID=UPI00266F3330|nr:P-type conjugative transfer ATPase TrbB [uncultured Bilophila sp.]
METQQLHSSWETSLRVHMGQLVNSALDDPMTCEVMLNPDGRIWQERFGEPMKCIGSMRSGDAEVAFRTLASLLGKTLSYEQPQLDGEYPGGFRFSGALPPVVSGPTFAIRKPASRVFTLDEYVETSTMTERQKEVLCEAVTEHLNILVIGGTGSGKTTLANAIIAEMVQQYPDERHVIIEDTREIQCTAPNAVFFHTTSAVSMTKCLKQTLRLRPTRIHVGEVRDEAALDLLDAWNTGHAGGVSTIHANSARQGLSRLRGLVSRSPHAPHCIEEVIGEAVQRIVFMERTQTGRRLGEILAVDAYSSRNQEYQLRELVA